MSSYEDIIRDNAKQYYTTGEQKLSDTAFDAVVNKVREENPQSDVLTTGWGYTVNADNKVRHKYGHIGSLRDIHDWDEFKNKFTNNEVYYDVSAKLDGLSMVLYFKDGILDLALTRGDGEYGIDKTEKMKYILNKDYKAGYILCIYDKQFTGAVRGEVKMLPKDFKQYKEKHPEAKNHRNSAAGIINSDGITEDCKYLTFVAYSVVGDEFRDYTTNTEKYTDIRYVNNWLKENFAFTAPRETVALTQDNYEEVLKGLRDKWSKDFYIDGVVISEKQLFVTDTDEIEYNHAAFKFADKAVVTKITGIEWNMSKNSEMIPVLLVEPVELEGTTVKRVTAFNAKFVRDNRLNIGVTILICKRNQIIPYVMEVIEPAMFPALPVSCPYCEDVLLWDENHVHLRCFNRNCVQKRDERLKAICMNLAPVAGLGWKTINKCFNDSYYVYGQAYEFNTFEDLLNAKPIPGVTYGHGEMGTFNEMLYVLQTGQFKLSQFLLALNIPGLGKISAKRWEDAVNAKDLCEYIGIDATLKTKTDTETVYTQLLSIIQDKTTVYELMTKYSKHFKEYYDLIKDRIVFNDAPEAKITSKGEVVITGALSIKRAEFEQLLTKKGWKLSNSLNKNTAYLITNTPDSETTKNKKADALGITKVSEKDFLENLI